MSPGPNYIAMMIQFEGEILHPYHDSTGLPTIGIGSTRYENGNHVAMTDQPITHQRAIDLLLWATLPNQRLLNSIFPDGKLTRNQNDSILSFIYNEGAGAFRSSTLLKLMQADPNDPNIRHALMMWDKEHVDGQLVFNQGLHDRRIKEGNIYFTI